MLVTNRDLAFAVINHIKDIDAYMLGQHELEFNRILRSIPHRHELNASLISKVLSSSSLWRYRIKIIDSNEIFRDWRPFVGSQSFNELRESNHIKVEYIGEEVDTSFQLSMANDCIQWCRKFLLRGVVSNLEGVRLCS